MTFKEQLLITILDKAVIGIMLAIGAYLFNRSLERFKSEQSLSNEFTKQRLVKIAELWEHLYAWESRVVRMSCVVARSIALVDDDGIPLAVERTLPELLALRDDEAGQVLSLIERNRFWLGDELHAQFWSYHVAIRDHLALLLERPRHAEAQHLIGRLAGSRSTIMSVFSGSSVAARQNSRRGTTLRATPGPA